VEGREMSILTWSRDKNQAEITVDGKLQEFCITCEVRTLANGKRRVTEVVTSIPAGKPYDVQKFPKGLWTITGIEPVTASKAQVTYGPVKIRTDAHQKVKVWALDQDGDYDHETSEETDDTGYLLHFSQSSTTWGCGRIGTAAQARKLASILKPGDRLEVI
jgi:hypothetical protein